MLTGDLPIEDGHSSCVGYSHESNTIMVEINGSHEELSVIEAVSLIGKLSAMVEVVLSNART